MISLRLQKILSLAGVASRRAGEELISSGKIKINEKIAKLGDKADIDSDVITINDKPIKVAEDKIYLALNKPKGYVSTKSDPENRKTIYELLPKDLQNKVWSIGRLDFQTEGLIILTNDGELTQKLSHPSFKHEKEYEVVINKIPTNEQLQYLQNGVEIASGKTYPAKVKIINNSQLVIIRVTLHEGKNRQIRRMVEAVGLKVKNLKRIGIGKLKLPEIKSGQFIKVKLNDVL